MKRLKKDLWLPANKLVKKQLNPCNAKEHYQSVIKIKITKSVTQSKMITSKPKAFENRNIVNIISVTT